MKRKPLASISLDLDNQWAYMKTHGDAGWETFPSYFDVFVPHALEALRALKLEITVFVVGQDAALERNRDALRALVEAGHELGNHSFHHEQWIHTFSGERILHQALVQRGLFEDNVVFRGLGLQRCDPDGIGREMRRG